MAPKPAKALTKKAGPLPIWAWALVGGGALLAAYLLLRRNTTQAGAGISLVSGNAQKPQDAAWGGYPQGGTPAAQMLSEEVLREIAGGLTTISADQKEQHSSLGERVAGVKDAVAQTVAGATLQPPAVSTPTAVAAGSAPKIPSNQPGVDRYYSFKPGNAPAGRRRDEAPKGSRLGFRAGRGYYVLK